MERENHEQRFVVVVVVVVVVFALGDPCNLHIYLPGSSEIVCKNCVPKFTKQNLPKGGIFTYLEDPGTT